MADNEGDIKGRISTLEGRWKHTDARIEHLDGRLSGAVIDLSAIKADVSTLIKAIDGLAHKTNAPTNWIGVAALIFSIVVGGSQYVDLRLMPILSEIDQNRQVAAHNANKLGERSEFIGSTTQRLNALEDDKRTMYAIQAESREKISSLEAKAAAAEVSRKAIGDYLRQVDELGSRHWIGGRPERASKVGNSP
jgi:hypothetical protein